MDAGLERALRDVGFLQQGEPSAQAVAEATPPPNTQRVVTPLQPPGASVAADTTSQSELRERTLEEEVAVLSGQAEPTTAEQAATDADPEQPQYTERELELIAERDRHAAEAAELKAAREDDEYGALWDQRWNEGQYFYEVTVPDRIRQKAAEVGASETDVMQAMLIAERKHRQWNEQFRDNEDAEWAKRDEIRARPSEIDALVKEHGFSPEDRAILAKYLDQPQVMRDIAAAFATRNARDQTRSQQAVAQAKDEVAVAMQRNTLTPVTTTNRAADSRPYQWKGGKHDYEEAAALAQLIGFKR